MRSLPLMLRYLRALPFLALLLAALETYWVRREFAYRPAETWLFPQVLLLWGALGLVVCPPAYVTGELLRKGGEGPPRSATWRAAIHLGLWMLAPVAAHMILDRYTGIGGNLRALLSARPWIELSGLLLAFLAVGLVAYRFLLRLAPGRVALATAATALFVGGLSSLVSGRGAEPTTARADRDRPNLLLLVWDTCRSDRLGSYGYGRGTTPALDRLAQDAHVFETARSVAIFTFTSHLTLLTGVHPSVHGGRLHWLRYQPHRAESVAELLRREGYRTAGFVGTDVLAGHTGIRHGFEVYDDRTDPALCETHAWEMIHDVQSVLAARIPALRNNGRPHWFQDFQRPAEEVLARAQEWIEEDDPRPWFCFVNLYDVHWPYLPDESSHEALVRPYDGPLDGFLFRSDAWQKGYKPNLEDRAHVSDLYDAELLELDRTVEEFLGSVDLDATAVLLTSDHGEAFGDEGRWKHEDILENQVRVPMILRPPGGLAQASVHRTPVSGVDVAPTLLGLAGLPVPEHVQGRDLSTLEPDPERPILVENRDNEDPRELAFALYRGPWKLVRREVGDVVSHELFDLRRDPLGVVDRGPQNLDLLEELRLEIEAIRALSGDDGLKVDAMQGERLDVLRALGYAQ